MWVVDVDIPSNDMLSACNAVCNTVYVLYSPTSESEFRRCSLFKHLPSITNDEYYEYYGIAYDTITMKMWGCP